MPSHDTPLQQVAKANQWLFYMDDAPHAPHAVPTLTEHYDFFGAF